MTTYGIDISGFQSGLTLTTLRSQGFSFLMAKCTEGRGYVDASYPGFRAAAQREGLLFAAYHYLLASSSTDAQAANLAGNIGDPSIPVMLDVEANSGDVGNVRAMIASCARVGLRVTLVYLPRWYWANIGSPSLGGLPALVASSYADNVRGIGTANYARAGGDSSSRWAAYGGVAPAILQFTSSGSIGGYGGPLDMNAYRGTVDELRSRGWFKDYTTPTPSPTPPEDIVTPQDKQDIIAGVLAALRVPTGSRVLNDKDGSTLRNDTAYIRDQILGRLDALDAAVAALAPKPSA